MGRAACILTGLYVCRSQLSSGSEVDPDEFPLGTDGTKSEGSGQKRQNVNDLLGVPFSISKTGKGCSYPRITQDLEAETAQK